ncbi:unnamed protein product [Oikopleura dioica]|nr:unnamed protein product [Oikopleura dioica]
MRLPKLYEFYGIDESFVTRFQPILKHKWLTKDEDYANNWPARSQNYNCTIFAHPYRSKFIKMSEEDEKLWKEIVRATPRPQYISKMAEEFIEEEMSQRFLAIHWRYDRIDFLSKGRCRKFTKTKRKRRGLLSYERACKEFYPLLSDVTPLATKILEFTTEHNFRHVFLALPPIEIRKLGNSIKEKLAEKKVFVKMEGAVKNFVLEKYPDCDYFREHTEDMLSLLEQEIVSKSTFFIRSLRSTWSSNIYFDRISHGINTTISVLDLMGIDIYAKPKPDK